MARKNKNKHTFNLDMSKPYSDLVNQLKTPLSKLNEKWLEFKALCDAYHHDQVTEDFVKSVVKERDHLKIVPNNSVAEDHLALFLFKKHPSPARLRRIWRTTKEFFDSCIKEIFENGESYITNIRDEKDYEELKKLRFSRIQIATEDRKEVLSGTYEGSIENDISNLVLYYDYNRKTFISICNLQPHKNIEQKFKELSGKTLKIKSQTTDKASEIFLKIEKIKFDDKKYLPFVEISNFPSKLQVIVPASSAFDIAKKIKEKYETEFSKVRNRLSFHIGIVYMHKKHPIYSALEASERIVDVKRTMEKFEVADIKKKCDVCEITLKNDQDATITITVPTITGDKNVCDNYYPFYIVNEGLNVKERETYFQTYIRDEENILKVDLVHVKDLKQGDKIMYDPSYFDFQFLDTSARRFEIIINKDTNKRKHDIFGKKGPKPYYLEDIDNFTKLWEILNDKSYNITSSQINNLSALLTSKIQEWNLEDKKLDSIPEFVNLVENSIVNIFRMDKKDDKFKFIKN
ncbi:MAG: hypothetical protein BWK75_05480, partial [Candidatus Altiarchaeales archaeon A3]